MKEIDLLAIGALKTQCSESLMGYCSCSGGKFSGDEAQDGRCPICGQTIEKFICSRCDGEFTASPVNPDHVCQSVSAYRKSAKVAFHEAQLAASEAQRRAEAIELARARHLADLERRAEESELRAKELERAKARELEAANRRAKEAEDQLAAFESAHSDSTSRTPFYPPLPDAPAKTLKLWTWLIIFVVGISLLYLKFNKVTELTGLPSNMEVNVEKITPANLGISKSLFPRCAGSYEPEKCEEFEKRLMAESETVKSARNQSLEQGRKAAMDQVMRDSMADSPEVSDQICSSQRDYDLGIRNGLKMAPPCQTPDTGLKDRENGTNAGKEELIEIEPSALNALSRIVKAVNARISLSEKPTQGVIADVDEAVAFLNNLSKPQRGDRRLARAFLDQGLGLLGQDGKANDAVKLLMQAHEADPLDVQILNDLAYAELMAQRYEQARIHLLQVLKLAPSRSGAWFNLAELRVSVSNANENQNAIDDSVRCFIVGYWFSSNRGKALQYIRDKATMQSELPLGKASQIALQRLALLDLNQ